jgi:hypothetical protein
LLPWDPVSTFVRFDSSVVAQSVSDLGLFSRAAWDEALHLVLEGWVIFSENFKTLFYGNLFGILSSYWAEDNFLLLLLL